MVVHKKTVLRLHSILVTGLALVSMAWLPASASAQFVASGSSADGALNGEADFMVSSNQIVIALSNLLANTDFKSPGQAVSDVSFTLTNKSGTAVGGTPSSDSSGSIVNIGTNSNPTPLTIRWMISGSPSLYEVTTLSGGQPQLMIAPSGPYPNVNKGVKNFNPYYSFVAMITIKGFTGVSAGDTQISNVSISFGTGPDVIMDATPGGGGTVPAPPSIIIAMTGVGAIGFAGFALSSRRRKAIPA
jgi:hypothetical protein